MKVQNELAAKVLGDILAEGMSISGFDIADKIHSEAADALDEIRLVLHDEMSDEKKKLCMIDGIMQKHNIK